MDGLVQVLFPTWVNRVNLCQWNSGVEGTGLAVLIDTVKPPATQLGSFGAPTTVYAGPDLPLISPGC